MKNRVTKIIALTLCTVLTVGIAGTALADDSIEKEEKEQTAAVQSAEMNDGGMQDTAENAIAKEETVYVLAGADGATQNIIVSDWLKNTDNADTLRDWSELSDIENVNGEETYTSEGNHTYVWDAKGNDIYYQGNIEKELPVTMKVHYMLDGKEISPSELAGKSGKVTIRFEYTNQEYEFVTVNGMEKKMYVPFAVMTGMVLDHDIFHNVEVTNGKLLNDGGRTVVAGIAFPGLQENLEVDADDFEIPDYVEMTADVTGFEMGMTATVVTNEVFNEVDVDEVDSIDELQDSLGELTDAMGQLLDGSAQLYDGLHTLQEKSGELSSGVNELSSGAETLKAGVGSLDAGVSQLQAGAEQLSAGLGTIVANNDTLNGGARQVFETLLATADSQLAQAGLSVPTLTIGNYGEVLTGVIASLDENAVYEQALAQVTAAVEAQRPYIEEQVTAAIREMVKEQVTAAVKEQVTEQVTAVVRENVEAQVILSATGMDKASYEAAVAAGMVDEATQAAIQSAIEAQMVSESVQAMINANVEEQMASESVQAVIAANVEEQMQSDSIKETIAANTEAQVQKAIADHMASDEVVSQLAAASEGAKSVITLKTSLDSYNAFYLGLQNYTAAVAQAAAGAAELKTGADSLKAGSGELYDGTSKLCDGIQTLKNSTPNLLDGVDQLADGALKLSDGLQEFDEKGIQKLVDAVDGDLDGLVERIRAMVDISKNYKTFAGIDENMSGQVKFIYRTEAVEGGK